MGQGAVSRNIYGSFNSIRMFEIINYDVLRCIISLVATEKCYSLNMIVLPEDHPNLQPSIQLKTVNKQYSFCIQRFISNIEILPFV